MKFLDKLFKRKKQQKVSETEMDKKLQNNEEYNTTIIEVKDSIDNEIESFIAYVNNYKDLMKYGNFDEDNNYLIERELSCIKIILRSSLNITFLNSLDFFQKINHLKKSSRMYLEDYLDWQYIIDPDMSKGTKICMMISGSIQDYIDFINNYQMEYAIENNIVVGVILREMKKFPIVYDQFASLVDEYNLDLKHNFDVQGYEPKRDMKMEKILANISNNPKDILDNMIVEATTFDNGYDDSYVPESFREIIKLLWKKELDSKKFNCIIYNPNLNRINKKRIPYEIKSFSKLFYFTDHSLQEEFWNSIQSLQNEHDQILNDFKFSYHNSNIDSNDETDNDMNHQSMLDMIDEMII